MIENREVIAGQSKSQVGHKGKIDFLIVIIYFGAFVCNYNESYLASFLSDYLDRKYQVSETMMGVIFSSNSLFEFIASIMIGILLRKNKIKRKTMLIWACIFQVISSFVLIQLQDFPKTTTKQYVQYYSIISRCINGLGTGVLRTITLAYIPIFYQDSVENKVSNLEIWSGIGLTCGPFLGGLQFQEYGYTFPYLFSIGLTSVFMLVMMKMLSEKPFKVEESQEQNNVVEIIEFQQVKSSPTSSSQSEQKISEYNGAKNLNDIQENESFILETGLKHQLALTSKSQSESPMSLIRSPSSKESSDLLGKKPIMGNLRHSQILLPLLLIMIVNSALSFFDPTLAVYLDKFYDEDAEYSGFILSLKELIYISCCPLCACMMIKFKKYRTMVYVGGFLVGFSMFLFGPNQNYVVLPKHLAFPIIASFVSGIGVCLVFLPVIKIVIQNLEAISADYADEEYVGNASSVLFNGAYSVGGFIGPVCAGLLVDLFDSFPLACAFYGFLIFFITLIYLILGKNLNLRQI